MECPAITVTRKKHTEITETIPRRYGQNNTRVSTICSQNRRNDMHESG